MRRSGPPGPLARARLFAALAGRILALVAALVMAVNGAAPGRAHAGGAEPGLVMVICSDGVAKTIVLDAEGNPIDPAGEESCTGLCLCCPVFPGAALVPDLQAHALPVGGARDAVLPVTTAIFAFERWLHPLPHGPPSKDKT